MAEIKPADLFGRLNPLCYRAMEGATTFCKLRGNSRVELVHWWVQVLNETDSDAHRIIRHFELDDSRVAADLTAALNRLPASATSISGFSETMRNAVEQGWIYASLMFHQSQVRSGHIILGILKDPSLQNFLFGLSNEFRKFESGTLSESLEQIVEGSPEDAMQTAAGATGSPGDASGAIPPAEMGEGKALAKFSVDLTEKARSGEIDPIFGRDPEIRQIIDILMRRRQNNPILTGEAGVGKTAAVEGFALRIAAGDVPPALKGVTLRTLDLGMLQAGASMKGEFEERLRQVIEEVQSSPEPIILFIDEAHQLIGAGGAAGTADAANLLKPALARGTLRTIAATTWREYKKYFETDPALTRRFQVIQIDEPEEDSAIVMIRGLAERLEKHHQVLVLDEALQAAVKLSSRHLPARQLPDKAVSLIDTACARVSVSQHATPPAIEDLEKGIAALEIEIQLREQEAELGQGDSKALEEAKERKSEGEERLQQLTKVWEEEKKLVKEILKLRAKVRQPEHEEEEAEEAEIGAKEGESKNEEKDRTPNMEELRQQLQEKEQELAKLQGENPLIFTAVDGQVVASVVSDWTGIPVGRMVRDEVQTILNLADHLEERVIGQRHALEEIAKRIETSRAGLDDPNKPIGVFLLAGTSGVGKTETALALAETLYGGEDNLITLNMSEFQEAHTVSTLKGAPPGYVGYGEGGVLTEAVRRRPYSVVLLDEVEKAHPDIHEVFFQVFDKGVMEDGEGQKIDFKNTVIILTTNVGTEQLMKVCERGKSRPEPEEMDQAIRPALLNAFAPAWLGRMITLAYYPLGQEVLELIIRLKLDRIGKRLLENRGVEVQYGDDLVELVKERCQEVESGGRIVDAILTKSILPEISRMLLVET
ncbi:MAG: type VI secretion system ATPase TssH, partial [Verrucomicrobiota bacterium]